MGGWETETLIFTFMPSSFCKDEKRDDYMIHALYVFERAPTGVKWRKARFGNLLDPLSTHPLQGPLNYELFG